MLSLFFLVPILHFHVIGDTAGLLLFCIMLAFYRLPHFYSKNIVRCYTWFIHLVVVISLFHLESQFSFEFVLYVLSYALYTSIPFEKFINYDIFYSFLFIGEVALLYLIRYKTVIRQDIKQL